MDGTPQRIAEEIWRDRLTVQRQKTQHTADTVEAMRGILFAKQTRQGQWRRTECRSVRCPARPSVSFSGLVGPALPITSITAKVIVGYHSEILKGLSEKKWSTDYAQNRISAVKSFVRWLWRIEAIEQLPRVLDSKELNITKKVTTPQVLRSRK